MIKTIKTLEGLNIYRSFEKHANNYISAVVGENKNIQIDIYKNHYKIKVLGKENKFLLKEFSHDDNVISSIIYMQKIASIYLH